jgi:hypothetical protein
MQITRDGGEVFPREGLFILLPQLCGDRASRVWVLWLVANVVRISHWPHGRRDAGDGGDRRQVCCRALRSDRGASGYAMCPKEFS